MPRRRAPASSTTCRACATPRSRRSWRRAAPPWSSCTSRPGSRHHARASASYPTTPTATSSPTFCASGKRRPPARVHHGLRRQALVMDPGLGFTKNARHSLALLSRTRELVDRLARGRRSRRHRREPEVVSRRRRSQRPARPSASGPPSWPRCTRRAAGAAIVRVHDVRATAQALDLDRRLSAPSPAAPAPCPPSPGAKGP